MFLSEELVSRGHSSLLAFSRMPPDWLMDRFHSVGADIIQLDPTKRFATLPSLMRTVKQYGVDVIHCTFIPMFSSLTGFMRLSSAKRLVFSDQTSRSLKASKRYKKPIHYAKNKMLARLIDLIIADAEYIRRSLVTDSYVHDSKIVTLYNGVNLERFKPGQNGTLVREEFKIDPHTRVVTTIASAIHEKGLDVYLRAAKEVVKYYPNTVFFVVGDGPLLSQLKGLAVKLGISEHVIFTGLRNDTHEILAVTDIAVLLSRWGEAFSFAMLEVMASGKPLVASEIGAIPEAVDHERTGFLVPPGDHTRVADTIMKVLSDERLMRDIGNAAREKCEKHYDIRTMVKKTVDIYESFDI